MKPSFVRRFEQGFAETRVNIERSFERWGYWVFDHAWTVLLVCLLLLGGTISQIPKLKVDTSTEGFLHEADPIRRVYNEFRFQFGRDERILIVVDSGEGNTIFTVNFLEKLRALHQDIEKTVPKIQDIKSLVNARLTRGENDELIVKDFLEDWPRNDAELTQLRDRALGNEIYLNQFLSRDGRYAIIMIENDAYTSEGQQQDALAGFDSDTTVQGYTHENHPPFLSGEENTAIVLAVEDVLKRNEAPGFKVNIAGTPFMVDRLTRILLDDMTKFSALSMLIVAGLLTFIFRRVVMIFVPLLVSTLAMMSTMGFMALVNIPLTTAAQIMPSFLLTVGVANAVHIFVIFFQRSNLGESKRDALGHSLGHSGLAIAMTSFTTIAGLISFYGSDVKPVSDFGIITPLGVLNALICALVVLPALIAILPIRQTIVQDHTEAFSQRVLSWCADLTTSRPWTMVFAWFSLVIIALFFAVQMRFSHNPVAWFPKDDPFRIVTELINDKLGGGMFIEIVVDSGKEDGLKDPELLRRMDQVRAFATEQVHGGLPVEKVISMVDIIKEINQALHNNDPAYYIIPDDKALLAQEILLFENSGSGDLEQLVDSKFSKARMTMKLPFVDAVQYPAFERALYPKIHEMIGDKAKVSITGLMAMMGKTVNDLLKSMATSYVTSAFSITLMMIIFVGSIRIGLLSMVPNISPIIITLGIMVIAGLPLDAFTLLIGSIGLGLAVDDTIHFMNSFQRYFYQTQDPELAVRKTMATAGEAMFFTAAILSSAFFVYIFATMNNLRNFGLLTGMCILIAASADAFLNPALMFLYGKHKLRTAVQGEKQVFS